MNKTYLFSILFCFVIGIFYYFSLTEDVVSSASSVYVVYLQGEEIGVIASDQELYDLINEEQKEIKEQYNVDYVYPPSDLDVIKVNSYNEKVSEVEEIYALIEDKENFTIKGYEVKIKSDDDETIINVLDKEVFSSAIDSFVAAYIDSSTYEDYMFDDQAEIVDTGTIITDMYFSETISIQEAFISVDEDIYIDESELLQFLIFGEDADILKYTVKAGDTISSIANDNKLNVSEFLISNPEYRNESNMLVIGSTVNVTLQNPVINFVYVVEEVAEQEVDFINTNVYDNNYGSSYSEVTTPGVTGIDKVSMSYEVTNGITSQEVEILNRETIRESVDQVTTVGVAYVGTSTGDTIYTGLTFTSPVDPGFIVTSVFGEWRESYSHNGVDFSGTGYNSPIYAIADGVVTQAANACSSCSLWDLGTYIVIDHGNNYYSIYMHMVVGSLTVSVGDTVTMGQQIGGMGSTGWSTGTHLHLGFAVGEPMVESVTYYDIYAMIFG